MRHTIEGPATAPRAQGLFGSASEVGFFDFCDWVGELLAGLGRKWIVQGSFGSGWRYALMFILGIAMVSGSSRKGRGENTGERDMRKLIAGTAIAGLFIMGGGTAFAGEVNGQGKPTPVANPDSGGRFVAGSICAFNGLDDGSETGNPVTPGVVQSFGSLVAGEAREAGGAGSFAHVIHDEGPGTNCHGFASGGGEE